MQIDEKITLQELQYHWEQDEKKHATMSKIFDNKLNEQKEALDRVSSTLERHGEILQGISDRFDKLNGSVAKHELRHNEQDVMNAQTTLSQQNIAKLLETLIKDSKENTDYRLKATGATNTFKWIVGFIGLGTLATLVKVFFQ